MAPKDKRFEAVSVVLLTLIFYLLLILALVALGDSIAQILFRGQIDITDVIESLIINIWLALAGSWFMTSRIVQKAIDEHHKPKT